MFKHEMTDEDLSKCPQCGGDADNGIDRCIPPSAYMCKKCCEIEVEERAADDSTHNAIAQGREHSERPSGAEG